MGDDDKNNEASTMLLPIDDQICEMCINNVRLGVCHEDDVVSDATTLVTQLPERFLRNKKPSLGKDDSKLKESQELNPQFNIYEFKLTFMIVIGFCT